MKIGFGKETLRGAYHTAWPQADDIDARALVCSHNGCTAALVIADVLAFWPNTCARLAKAIAAHLKIPIQNVGIFTTQNHGVRTGDNNKVYDLDRLERAFVSAANSAAQNLQNAQVSRVCVYPSPQLNIHRRFHLPNMGAFTFWWGYHNLSPSQTDASHLLKLALNNLAAGKISPTRSYDVTGNPATDFKIPPAPTPIAEPTLAAPAPDGAVQGLFFRNADNHRPIGSILRIAMHPVAANRAGAQRHSGDYPAYARRRLEETFGGQSMFLMGCCGNSVPRLQRKSLEFAQALGRDVADQLLSGFKDTGWNDGAIAVESPNVELKLRSDFPASPEKARAMATAVESKIHQLLAAGAPLHEIKPLADQHEFLTYAAEDSFTSWCGLTQKPVAGGAVPHPLFFLRIADNIIAGLPGEAFNEFSVRLRNETIGDRLMVIEEANGYISYIPTAAQFSSGGYECNAAPFVPETEETLITAARRAVDRLLSA